MGFAATDFATWTIEAPGDEVAQYAASAMRAELGCDGTGAGRIRLQVETGLGEHVEVEVGAELVVIRGRNARAMVDGVMWFLQQVGCYWVDQGQLGPCRDDSARLEAGTYAMTPAIARRTLVLGQDALHTNWREWMEWASRNRYNDLFFHDTPPSVWDRQGRPYPETTAEMVEDGRGWMFERWDADGPAIVAEARRRGMTLQLGGHHLPMLVPREHFADHPDWFPERKGVREPRYNLCTSSDGAMAELRRNTERYFDRFPGADLYHLWADDIVGGGWCGCPACDGLSASDQALRATNAIAEVLAQVNPGAMVVHLAYHDTIEPPVATVPLENVAVGFAPRERDYSRTIDAKHPWKRANCDRYWEPMQGLKDLFPADRRFIFEYYSDGILFKGLTPPHLKLLPQDVMAYREFGVAGIANLMVGPVEVWAPIHAWWFAQGTWDPATNPGAIDRLCLAAYGEHGVWYADWYRLEDEVDRLVFSLEWVAPNPRGDVLDFGTEPYDSWRGQPLSGLQFKVGQLAEALLMVSNAMPVRRPPPRSSTSTAPDSAWHRRCCWDDQMDAVRATWDHLAFRTAALHAATEGNEATARLWLMRARQDLSAIASEWGSATGEYFVIMKPMLRWFERYGDNIERMLEQS